MIDTININLHMTVKGVDRLITKYYFTNRKPKLLRNLRIKIFDNGVHINGSLTKYIAGTNLYTPSYFEIKEALLEIGETLKVDIREGTISKIDIANNFRMNEPVPLYLNDIWTCPRTKLMFYFDESITFRNYSLSLKFYDKLKQMMKKNKMDFLGTNYGDIYMLRIELSIKKNITKRFGKKQIMVEKLFNQQFYFQLIDEWLKYINRVKRVPTYTEKSFDSIYQYDLTPKQFVEHLAAIGFHKLTNKEQRLLFDSVDNIFDHNSRSRIREKLNSITSQYIPTVYSYDLWSEFDEKIEKFYEAYKRNAIAEDLQFIYNK